MLEIDQCYGHPLLLMVTFVNKYAFKFFFMQFNFYKYACKKKKVIFYGVTFKSFLDLQKKYCK